MPPGRKMDRDVLNEMDDMLREVLEEEEVERQQRKQRCGRVR